MNFVFIDGRRVNLEHVACYEAIAGQLRLHVVGVQQPICITGPRVPGLLRLLDSAARVSELVEHDPGPNVFDRLACSGFEKYGARGITLLFVNPDARDKALSAIRSEHGLPQPDSERALRVGDRVMVKPDPEAETLSGTAGEIGELVELTDRMAYVRPPYGSVDDSGNPPGESGLWGYAPWDLVIVD